jgi:hypothetical protein
MIKFACENCNIKLKISDKYSGKKIKYPECKNAVLVPSVNSEMVKAVPTDTIKCLICEETIQIPKSMISDTIVCPSCKSYVSPESASVGVDKAKPSSSQTTFDGLTDDEP